MEIVKNRIFHSLIVEVYVEAFLQTVSFAFFRWIMPAEYVRADNPGFSRFSDLLFGPLLDKSL